MEYLIGTLILAAIWGALFVFRRDLRHVMIWSSSAALLFLSVGFIVIRLLLPDLPVEMTIVPGYWDPDTLFNFGRITGGFAIEDALFMFFTGGISGVIYEEISRRHLSRRRVRHVPHLALAAGAVSGFASTKLELNLVYGLIIACFVGAFVIWIQRHDLIKHSFLGGLAFFAIYSIAFLIFLLLFPDYIQQYYSIHNISGVLLIGLPLEELLFAFGFGLLWSPIYEYVKDLR
ncbi:MAG: lycopene cyclase domain-containing protein [Patescibacteria group bacterium]